MPLWFCILGFLSFVGPASTRNGASILLCWMVFGPVLFCIYLYVLWQPQIDSVSCAMGSQHGCYSLTQFEVAGLSREQYDTYIRKIDSIKDSNERQYYQTTNRRWWVIRKENLNGKEIRTIRACFGVKVPIYDMQIEQQCFDRQILQDNGNLGIFLPSTTPYTIVGYWNNKETRHYDDGVTTRTSDLSYYWDRAYDQVPQYQFTTR